MAPVPLRLQSAMAWRLIYLAHPKVVALPCVVYNVLLYVLKNCAWNRSLAAVYKPGKPMSIMMPAYSLQIRGLHSRKQPFFSHTYYAIIEDGRPLFLRGKPQAASLLCKENNIYMKVIETVFREVEYNWEAAACYKQLARGKQWRSELSPEYPLPSEGAQWHICSPCSQA